jgi:acyl transferase domain-containing protein
VKVAYYRGLHAVSAQSLRGSHVKGAMVAVGSSRADVDELLTDELFAGRLSVAASNSSTSVTVSGDEDAITELELVLEDEDTFYRRLKVDKAYHSAHMLPCSEKYQESIEKLGIDIRPPQEERCAWFSSLKDGQRINADMATQLADTYWPDNMTKPVLFAEALSSALDADTYDVALEIGPHPALAAPAKQVMRDCLQKELPYYGSQFRGGDAVESLAAMLGSLWCHLGLAGANLDKFERDLVGLGKEFRYSLAKGLPSYTWNHDRRYWHESRQSRKMRLRPNSVHPLLGDITPDSAPHHTSWRNLLKPSELEWLPGHAVQGQTVFPASGYLASALEAAAVVAQTESKPIRMISIHDFVIKQAMPFTQDDTGIEVLIELIGIKHVDKGPRHSIHADFTYSSAIDSVTDNLVLTACGRIVIQLGDPSPDILQPQTPLVPHMLDVEPERFYSALADLGYNFEGPFRSLSQLRRKRGKASCRIGLSQAETSVDKLLIHPTELDAVLQTAILAYSYPYDDELRTLHLPTEIREIRFNLAALQQESVSEARVNAEIHFDTRQNTAQVYREPGKGIVANISVYPITESERSHAAIQVFGAAFMPLGGSSTEGDRSMYSQVRWVPDKPDGVLASQGLWDAEIQRETVCLLERIAIFYLRQFDRDVPPDHPARGVSPMKWYLNHARHVLDVIESGKHQWWQPEWENDTVVTINEASAAYRHLPDVEIMHLVGTQMPRVFQGETTMLEEFRIGDTNVLDRYYAEGIGLQSLAQWVARAIKQLVDRHPHMSILEVGKYSPREGCLNVSPLIYPFRCRHRWRDQSNLLRDWWKL